MGVLLFDEMGRRLAAKGCQWADLSLTGEEDTDTWQLAHRMGAKLYKRYQCFEKEVCCHSEIKLPPLFREGNILGSGQIVSDARCFIARLWSTMHHLVTMQ